MLAVLKLGRYGCFWQKMAKSANNHLDLCKKFNLHNIFMISICFLGVFLEKWLIKPKFYIRTSDDYRKVICGLNDSEHMILYIKFKLNKISMISSSSFRQLLQKMAKSAKILDMKNDCSSNNDM